MSRVLVDTSVWIDYFNGGNPKADALSGLIESNSICTNDLILAELVPFIRHEGQAKAAEFLFSVEKHEMNIDWRRLIEFQILNLKKGVNHVGIPDLIILQQVIDLRLALYTFDKHFELMSSFHGFELYGA